MKRISYKLIITLCFAMVIIKSASFAASLKTSTFKHFESTSSSGYSQCQETVEFNQTLTLNNLKVKLTQDDDTYTFKVTADNVYDIKNNIGSNCINNGNIHMEPFLYKSANFGGTIKIIESDCYPFASCNSGTMTDLYKLTINNKEIGYHKYEYRIYADGSTNTYENTSTDNGEKFFIPNETRFYLAAQTYNYKNRTIYPSGIPNNGTGVKLLNNNTKISESTRYLNGNIYVDSISSSFDATINIKKENIDDYRYLCFGATYVANTSEIYGTLTTTITGYSLCTNTVDLKNYIDCAHEWIAATCDETAHTVKCKNCEWEKKENHNFEYKYDGIDDDVCVCTKIRKVHYYYEINDDTISTVSEIYDVGEATNNILYTKKTGYRFKWYEKYELAFNVDDLNKLDVKEIPVKKEMIATVSILDMSAGSRSIYYKAIYEPIQYTFIYSNKSNLDDYISSKLVYDKEISPQTFYYDKKSLLKKHIDYDYLTFLGWTLTKGTDKVDFHKEQEIINYTYIDNKTYTLYPVYDTEKYKVLYNTLSGYYDNYMQQDSKEYDFYTVNGLLIPHDLGADKEFSHYIDINGNRFEELSEILDFVKTDVEKNKTVVLFANTRNVIHSEENKKNNNNNENNDDNNDGNSEESKSTGESVTGGEDTNNESTEGDNMSGESTGEKIDNQNENNNNGESKNEKNENNDNSGNNKDDNKNDENNNNVASDKGGNINSGSGSNSGNTSGTNGGTRISGGESGGGNSGGGGKNITSNGSIINGILTDNNGTLIDANNGTNATQSTKEYLMNIEAADKKDNKTSTEKSNIRKKKDVKKAPKEVVSEDGIEMKDNISGPRLLFDPYNHEGNIIRGTHGPWHFEKEYIDKILSERTKKQKELEEETLANKKEKFNLLNPKAIVFVVGSLVIIIFVILYEISTIRYYKKKRKLEMSNDSNKI